MRPDSPVTTVDIIIIVGAIIVGVLAAGRLTRLATADSFPPAVHLRMWWDARTGDSLWNPLLHCPWCLAPYSVAVVLAWALLSDLHWSWWLFNGWLAASYATSWVVFHDED